MGVWLRIDYPHSPIFDLGTSTNAQVEDLAWQVRHQLGYAYSLDFEDTAGPVVQH